MSEFEICSDSDIECPACGERSVSFSEEVTELVCGSGESSIALKATVPVGKCHSCGFRFTDKRAEKIRHDIYCRHVGIQTPDEIVALRQSLGLTRRQLAELSGIGEASIARWERGESFQNTALGNLLYLLTFGENRLRLSLKNRASIISHPPQTASSDKKVVQFRCLKDNPEKIRDSEEFQLRPAGS